MDVHPDVRPITCETTALSISPIIACHCTQPTHLKTGSTDIIARSWIQSTHVTCGSARLLVPGAVLNLHLLSVRVELSPPEGVLEENIYINASSCTQRTLPK